jgi:hypothetical protein
VGLVWKAAILLLAACGNSPRIDSPRSDSPPIAVESASVRANPNSVLSAIVSVVTTNVDKVRVRYGLQGYSDNTPLFQARSSPMDIPVLGLTADTDYVMQVAATTISGETLYGEPLRFRTGRLPSIVPEFAATARGDISPGYTMVSGIGCDPQSSTAVPVVIVDSNGRVVWYREVERLVTDWQKQPNGMYTAAVNIPEFYALSIFAAEYEGYDNLGNLIRKWTVTGSLPTDNHELRLLPNGDALLMGFRQQVMDLRFMGGRPDAQVIGNILQRLTPSGAVVHTWDAFSTLSIDNIDPLVDVTDQYVDGTHANSIDVTADGNYLISLRNFSQIIKVNASTREIMWKLGGRDSDFRFVNDPFNGISFQHAGRELPNGHILAFDNGNGHAPPTSRAVEYELDLQNRTATLAFQYVNDPPIYGEAMGFTQRLENGDTLITYGTYPLVQEVTMDGRVVWELTPSSLDICYMYRAIRIPSLY